MQRIAISLLIALFSALTVASPVWVDVRSIEEYSQDHIDGDIRISYMDAVSEIQKLFPDKLQEIYFYCRTGRRAGIAIDQLKAAGYTNLMNAGSIDNARKKRAIRPLVSN